MPKVIAQVAVLALHELRICMVSSRSGRRWVLPKGRIEARQTPIEAAIVEAWEEAGILGQIRSESIGTYQYRKENQEHRAAVYVMDVSSVRDDWPERSYRTREWLTVEEAVGRIEEDELQAIVRRFFKNAATDRQSQP